MTNNPSVIHLPSGSLNSSLDALMNSRPGTIKLMPGVTGSRKSSVLAAAIHRANDSTIWLPKGETRWQVNPVDHEYLVEATVRLRELLATKFAQENTSVVNEVFRRGAYPGTVAALRFCERYLMSGGAMPDLSKTGQIILTSEFDTRKFTAGNIDSISRVSVALYDAMYHPDMIPPMLKLAFEHEGRGDEIAALITERSITDAESIRSLLGESGSVLRVINDGVL